MLGALALILYAGQGENCSGTKKRRHTIADGIMSNILVISITNLSLVTYSLIMNLL
jgi:hypothetical protein